MKNRIEKIKEVVAKELSCSAHSFDHVMRVYSLALRLAEGENIDKEVLEAAALLHDIARVKEDTDPTGSTNHALLGAEMAGKILTEAGFPKQKIKHAVDCVRTHRNKGEDRPQTIEAKILFDADKLDSLGCIGIARAFAIGGQYGQRIYSEIPLEEYIKDNLTGGTIDGKIKDVSKHTADLEFETGCKLMPQKVYTKKAREIAQERLEYMHQFFTRMKKEINGEY